MLDTVFSQPATAVIPMDMREVLPCPHCLLVQFRTKNSLCRRCQKPLDIVEEPATPTAPSQRPAAKGDGLDLGTQVREIRRQGGLTQRQVAIRMAVPRTYISKVEQNRVTPTVDTFLRIAAALGVDARQLLTDERSRRDADVAAIFADSFTAALAPHAAKLNAWQRNYILCLIREPRRMRHAS